MDKYIAHLRPVYCWSSAAHSIEEPVALMHHNVPEYTQNTPFPNT